MKVLIIGGGNMGKSFAESFLNAKVLTQRDLTILEKDQEQIQELKNMKLGEVIGAYGDFIKEKDLIILAVKPQDADGVYPHLKPYINENHVILTVMAGVKIEEVESQLGTNKVIRAMPNLCCQVGLGVIGFMASNTIPQRNIDAIRKLLETTGISIQLYEEDQLNAITAVSGSGPAYVFYFMNAMIQKSMSYGFTLTEASKMVEQTFLGAVELYKVNELSCEQWIERVASKGGTTEAALKHFNNNDVGIQIQEGVEQAVKQSIKLSNQRS